MHSDRLVCLFFWIFKDYIYKNLKKRTLAATDLEQQIEKDLKSAEQQVSDFKKLPGAKAGSKEVLVEIHVFLFDIRRKLALQQLAHPGHTKDLKLETVTLTRLQESLEKLDRQLSSASLAKLGKFAPVNDRNQSVTKNNSNEIPATKQNKKPHLR